MQFLNQSINPLGMGCWPIGGAMFSGTQSLGYSHCDDAASMRTIHAALDAGITLFDTAAAYGAGHSERLLAKALRHRPEALVVTKVGIGIDEATKQLSFDEPTEKEILPAIDACLSRLDRDRIDVLLLHQNGLAIAQAEPIFNAMEQAIEAGKIRAMGWSTDYSDRTAAMAHRQAFVCVEHAMNVFFDAPKIQSTLRAHSLAALIRSPLAMGVLAGKYATGERLPAADIRATNQEWMQYFKQGQANPDYVAQLDAVRDLLSVGGRSLVQGALAWIWAKGAGNIPIPGARCVTQIQEIAGALAYGALPISTMQEIDTLIARGEDDEERPR